MIPVLYEPTETAFTHNGLGLLTDAITCTVSEELNGLFELTMTYPMDGIHADEIAVNCIIRAEPREEADTFEPFRIYRISRNINGTLTIYAQHATYQMNYIPCMPITKASMTASAALTAIKAAAAETCPINFSTDITTTKDFGLKEPNPMRTVIGGMEGSFLDTYGGEILWSWPNVQILKARGSDAGLAIEYGRNMTSLLNDDSMAGVITGICPYCRTTDGNGNEMIRTLSQKTIETDYASVFPFRRTGCVDLTDKFSDVEGTVTEQQLYDAACEFADANAVGVPRVSLEVGFFNVRHDLGYTLIDKVTTLALGDIVTVKFPLLGLSTKEKVVKAVYDVLRERYESVTVGRLQQDLATTINNIKLGTEVII